MVRVPRRLHKPLFIGLPLVLLVGGAVGVSLAVEAIGVAAMRRRIGRS